MREIWLPWLVKCTVTQPSLPPRVEQLLGHTEEDSGSDMENEPQHSLMEELGGYSVRGVGGGGGGFD